MVRRWLDARVRFPLSVAGIRMPLLAAAAALALLRDGPGIATAEPRGTSEAAAAAGAADTSSDPGATVAGDLPERIEPQTPRDEAGEDRLRASALLAQARLLFRREQFAESLQAYQRAYRYADELPMVAAEIVPLAFRIGRNDEAVAYAKHVDPARPLDPLVLNRLALELTAKQDYFRALELYRLSEPEAARSTPHGPSIVMRFEMGRLLYVTEQHAEAAAVFTRVREALEQPEPPKEDLPAIEALTEHAEISFSLMAEAALKAGEDDAQLRELAESLFRRAYRDRPDSPLLQLHLARVAVAHGQAEAAEAALDAFLKSGVTEAGTTPYELLAELLEKQGRSDQLVTRLESLLVTQPQNAYLAFSLAEALLRGEQWDRGVEVLTALQARQPLLDASRLLVEAHFRRRDADATLRAIEEAVGRFSELDLLQPQLSLVLDDQAFCDQMLARAAADQAAGVKEAAVPGTRHARSRAFALAQFCERRERMQEAEAYYREATGEPPAMDVEAGLMWGLSHLLAERPAQAAEVFRGLLEGRLEERERGLMEFHLSTALMVMGQHDEAFRLSAAASQRLPESPLLQLRPAWVLYRAGRLPESAKAYEEFLRRFGDRYGDAALRATVREAKVTLSSLCSQAGRADEAEEWLEQVLDEFPDETGVKNDLGYLWAERGVHLQRALRMVQQAIDDDPENHAFRDSLGWVLYRMGRYPEAVEQLRKAVREESPEGEILDHLAEAQLRAEGEAAARATWQRALEVLKPDDGALRRRIEEKLADLVRE